MSYVVSWNQWVVCDHTSYGGDDDSEYMDLQEGFDSRDEAFKRFCELDDKGVNSLTLEVL